MEKLVKHVLRISPRIIASFIAFVVGWVIYMIAGLLMPFTGFETMIGYLVIQPVFAAVTSILFVCISLALGFIFKKALESFGDPRRVMPF